jgi:predicted Zn finger-like uncharacterized protein
MIIIECNTCRARFRLDESKIKGRGARVRCRKCGDAIVVMRTAGPSAPPSPEAGENTLDLRTLIRETTADPPQDERAGDIPGSTAGEGVDAPATGKKRPRQSDAASPPDSDAASPLDSNAASPLDSDAASPPDDVETFAERFLPGREEQPERFGASGEPSRLQQSLESFEASAEEGSPSGALAENGHLDVGEGSSHLPAKAEEDAALPDVLPGFAPPEEAETPARMAPPSLSREESGTAESDLSRRSGEEHREDEEDTADRKESAAGERGVAESDEALAPGFTIDFAPEERLDFSIEERAGSSGEKTAWSAPSPPAPGGGSVPVDLEPPGFSRTARDEDRPDRRYDISGNIRLSPDVSKSGDAHPEAGAILPFSDDALRNTSSRAEELQKELQYLEDLAPPILSAPPPPQIDAAPPPKPAVRKPPADAHARRGREARPRPRVGSLFVLFLLLAGGGAYLGFTESGRDTLNTLLSKAVSLRSDGRESASSYDIGNLIGYYESTPHGGRMFVIKGQVTNAGRGPKSGIRIQASLLDGRAQEIARKSAFAGNVLAGEALRQASREAIEGEQSNRFGRNLINMDVAPGRSVPFMVVFFDAPDGIDSYRVEAQDGD